MGVLDLSIEDAVYLSGRIEKKLIQDYSESELFEIIMEDLQILHRIRRDLVNENKKLKHVSISKINRLFDKYYSSEEDRDRALASLRKERQFRSKSPKAKSAKQKSSASGFVSIRVSQKNKQWLEKRKKKSKCNSIDEVIDSMREA